MQTEQSLSLVDSSATLTIMAVDPGPVNSALLIWSPKDGVRHASYENNASAIAYLRGYAGLATLVIESMNPYGMTVGQETFDTLVWSGRFYEAFGPRPKKWLSRRNVKLHLCDSVRAADAQVRDAILTRFGGRETAIGTKRAPGPLYGIHGHLWSALALALAAHDLL